MNIVEQSWKEIADRILNGYDNIDDNTRTKWADGSGAYTLSTFATVTRYNLKDGLPITTLRNQYWKSAIKEMLWIWVKNSNKIEDLKLDIWNQWTDEEGTIGKAYGFQLGKVYDFAEGRMTQVERLLHLLTNDTDNRRMIVTLWNNEDMKEMNLTPCLHTVTFSVIDNKLNVLLDQRSGDFLVASGPGGYNEIQYAALTYMLAHIAGLEVGELVHVVANHHIYDRHIPYVKQLMNIQGTPSKLPKLVINPYITNFKDFTIEDFKLEEYKPVTASRKMDVAI